MSKFAHRRWTFKAQGTGAEGGYALHDGRFRLSPKFHHTIVIFVDIEDCLRFARIEPDLFSNGDQYVDPSDVQSFLETSREDLLVDRRFQALFRGVQPQFVRFSAPGYECWTSHPDVGLSRQACHGFGVCAPIRVCTVDERLRHGAYLQRVECWPDAVGEESTQLPVSEVRSWIDVVEVEDERGHVGHSVKLPFGRVPIKLAEFFWPSDQAGRSPLEKGPLRVP